jgi:hypothetical protein
MVSISPPTFDIVGPLLIQEDATSNMVSESRRVSRTATLDGGVAISDMGYAHGDRTFQIKIKNATRELIEKASYLHRNYPYLILANYEGVFLGAVASLALRNGELSITYLVKEKLTED